MLKINTVNWFQFRSYNYASPHSYQAPFLVFPRHSTMIPQPARHPCQAGAPVYCNGRHFHFSGAMYSPSFKEHLFDDCILGSSTILVPSQCLWKDFCSKDTPDKNSYWSYTNEQRKTHQNANKLFKIVELFLKVLLSVFKVYFSIFTEFINFF